MKILSLPPGSTVKRINTKKKINLNDVAPGEYRWAIGIIDKTRGNKPGIRLAIQNEKLVKGWSALRNVTIE